MNREMARMLCAQTRANGRYFFARLPLTFWVYSCLSTIFSTEHGFDLSFSIMVDHIVQELCASICRFSYESIHGILYTSCTVFESGGEGTYATCIVRDLNVSYERDNYFVVLFGNESACINVLLLGFVL